MKILSLAWRNVFRHTRRTIITALAISVGLGAMIYMDTMMNGVDKMASRNIIDFETSHIEVFAHGYYKEENFYTLDSLITRPSFIIEKLSKIQRIAAFTPRIKFQSRISNGIDELPVLGIGVDLEGEKNVFKIADGLVSGDYLKAKDDIIIGVDLARDLNLEVGSILTIITRDRNGTYNAYDFTVAGLINTGHPLFDRNAVIIPLETAQQLLSMVGMVTEFCVKVKDEDRIFEKKEAILNSLGNEYEAFTYKELNASIFQISGLKRSFQFLLALVVVIIAAVGIVNTMLMAVMERIPEIGTLKAMGFTNNNITKMFMYEGGIIGIFGSIAGCILGLIFSLHLSIYGLDLGRTFEKMNINYPMKFLIKGEINYMTILLVFLFGILVALIVTLLPVRRATKLEPVEALRSV